MLLLDTNILIDYLRDKPQAIQFINYTGKLNLGINTIVVLELYNGCLNRAEFAKIKRTLNGFIQFDLNESVAKAAIDISHTFALSHQLSVADTLIAATALVYDLELRTLNVRDFKMIPGLRVSNSLILP
ncbi:type II toxin-antitoxin system VapC family toxin [Dyadobacter sp. LJ53]|uniref:type II toxin-antitoxin system VapC family toxin n=1 Tax=Dyadobacter chenwenxiniae TaxID=2906456 RepID=UPI001F489A94|nr:type II toxin-antitoxin system VapC family toxin [Dyadobacter chenwenxiniae]MCF0052328.1 type II toxin-antitoxin system VapC family toxin [Dyadobacter chenwenxiniae]